MAGIELPFFTRLSFTIKVTESCCFYFTLAACDILSVKVFHQVSHYFITLGYCQYESNLFSDVCRVNLDQVVSLALL